jgi:hypothetical protein
VYVIQRALNAERTTRNGNEGKDGSDSGSSNGGK